MWQLANWRRNWTYSWWSKQFYETLLTNRGNKKKDDNTKDFVIMTRLPYQSKNCYNNKTVVEMPCLQCLPGVTHSVHCRIHKISRHYLNRQLILECCLDDGEKERISIRSGWAHHFKHMVILFELTCTRTCKAIIFNINRSKLLAITYGARNTSSKEIILKIQYL